jgi:curved DNA-binding protein CbpA
MFRKKNPRQKPRLVDARKSLAPTVGFRDYILSKKPSVKRQAKAIIESMADQLMETFGPGEDRHAENTFGIDERLDQAELRTAIERERLERAQSKGDERLDQAELRTAIERLERAQSEGVEAKFDTDQYYLLGDPYLILLLYRSIEKFSTEVVDRLREEKVASRVAVSLRPIATDKKKFDPYAILRVAPNASISTINKQIRKLKAQYHPDNAANESEREQQRFRRIFESVLKAKSAIGTQSRKARWDAERTLDTALTFADPNIIARWQSIGDVISVAYAAQKAAFEMIDRGDDYTKLIEELKSSSKLTTPQRKASPKRYSSLAYEENPKKKFSPEQKNRAVLKTERLWERYCRSEKFDDLLKAYEALLEAKAQVTQYKHKQQISQGLKQARAELKRHAK